MAKFKYSQEDEKIVRKLNFKSFFAMRMLHQIFCFGKLKTVCRSSIVLDLLLVLIKSWSHEKKPVLFCLKPNP